MDQLQGFKELDKKLRELGQSVGGRYLRQAVGSALTTTVKEVRQGAPKGTKAHRTYKGRLVMPGFLSRNIKKRTYTSKDKRKAFGVIGVSSEAYYGPQFLDRGTKHIQKTEFITGPFERNQTVIINNLKNELLKRIQQAARK